MSSSRANIRNEICSMTVSGLVMPPVQNSSQSLSILLRNWPVIMVVFQPQQPKALASGLCCFVYLACVFSFVFVLALWGKTRG